MERPLRMLSLGRALFSGKNTLGLLVTDGGGIRALSSLYVLRNILFAIRRRDAENGHPGPSSLRPCDYFDMIAGTGTGGLIVVMLGVLKMDIMSCIDAYLEIAPKIYPIEGIVSGSKFGRFTT